MISTKTSHRKSTRRKSQFRRTRRETRCWRPWGTTRKRSRKRTSKLSPSWSPKYLKLTSSWIRRKEAETRCSTLIEKRRPSRTRSQTRRRGTLTTQVCNPSRSPWETYLLRATKTSSLSTSSIKLRLMTCCLRQLTSQKKEFRMTFHQKICTINLYLLFHLKTKMSAIQEDKAC